MTNLPHLTDWGQYGLADIWNMVKGDDFTQNYNHVKAWQKMEALCAHQADSLRKAAAAIAERWPPQHSAAAGMFANRLESLAQTFTQASKAASTNGWTLHDVSVGLSDTHSKLMDLRNAWGWYERQESERARITKQALGPLGNFDQQTLLMMSNFDPVKSLVNLQGAPQIRSGWRQDLDQQARDLMTSADRDLLEARTKVTPVQPAHGDSAEYPWPPPPAGGGGGGGGTGFSGGGALTSVHYNPPPGQPGSSPWEEGETPPAWDPILDGETPPGGGPIPGQVPGQVPGQLPGGPGYPGGGPTPWVTTPIGRALAPGAVIGADRASSGGSRAASGMLPMGGAGGRPGTAGAGVAKGGYVAPPGGLIGGRPQSGKSGVGTMPAGGTPGSRRRRRPDDDDAWAVASGVPGVLVPDPEPDEHGPGPGVIGIDR